MTGEIPKEKVLKANEILKNSVIEIEQKSERDHDFSWDDEPTQKQETEMRKNLKRRIKSYTSSRIKTRNFLINIAYTGVKSKDFVDNNFTFDTITLITKNIDPFSLERKITDIIYMLWENCIEKSFYKHICENDNFIHLNKTNVLYSKMFCAQIVLDYLNKDSKNTVLLRRCLQNHMKTIQFVYLRCFSEIYSLIDKRGIDLKSNFLLSFKASKDKNKFLRSLVKKALKTSSKTPKMKKMTIKEYKNQNNSKKNLNV